MGLSEKLEAETNRSLRSGPPMRVDVVLGRLPAKDRKVLEAYLRDPSKKARAIERAMSDEGPEFTICEGAITKWRRRNGVTVER